MPVKFTEEEYHDIHNQLLIKGKILFEKHGFKKTSIDMIVNTVGIAKGSFYKFYTNKESLYYAILQELENKLDQEAMAYLREEVDFIKAYKIIIAKQVDFIEQQPLLSQSLDIEFFSKIWNKLSSDEKKHSEQYDLKKMMALDELAKEKGHTFVEDLEVSSGIMRSLVLMLPHKEFMGPSYMKVIDFHIQTTIESLFKEV